MYLGSETIISTTGHTETHHHVIVGGHHARVVERGDVVLGWYDGVPAWLSDSMISAIMAHVRGI